MMIAKLRAMLTGDPDADLRRLADDAAFPHREAARRAVRFRKSGDVADLVAICDDPHPCGMTEILFVLASSQRPWLNWVPMPSEAIINVANEVGSRRAQGEDIRVNHIAVSSAEPASAVAACRRVVGALDIQVGEFPRPDIRVPLQRGRYTIWRYDGTEPVPTVPPPSNYAVELIRTVADEPWPSLLSGYLQAEPLGELPVVDLLGLLSHLPGPPDPPRWRHLAKSTPTYWYRLMQPWVCLGILHHAADESWPMSARRKVLVDLAFGVEDWVADAALFALVTAAYRQPEVRADVRQLVRHRLDAAIGADRLVTIEASLAQLMLVTPGCRVDDRIVARLALARNADEGDDVPPKKRRWWRRQ
jgi:hypothetical protein